MIGAALYIMACSARNRVRRRLQRLREPRYLMGAAVGSVYLFFVVFGRRFSYDGRRRRAAPSALLPAVFGASGPALTGLLLLGAAAISWVVPVASGLLEYTPAETALLFPAPVSRRQLLGYRLIRAQWAVLLGAAIFAATYPLASAGARLRGLIAGWLLLMTCHVFFTGVTLARTRLRTASRGGRLLAWTPFLLTFGAVFAIGLEVAQVLWQRPVETAGQALSVLSDISVNGSSRFVLWPLVALVRPLFAESFAAFAWSLPAAIFVYLFTVTWVLRTDEALDLLTDQSVESQAKRPAKTTAAYRARPVAWTLALQGRAETAFVWKTSIQTFRVVDRRVLFRFLMVVLWIVAAATVFSRTRGFAEILGAIAAIGSLFTIFLGPQILRMDLRQDLQHLELLKTWPVRSAVVVRGELAWPGFVITCVAWTLAIAAIILSSSAFSDASLSLRMAVGTALLILTPALVFAQYTIHNAVALIFPAWIHIGRGRPRGVEAMGQRMIMLAATSLTLILVLAPGALTAGVLWLAFYRFMGPWVLIPASMICTSIVALEVLLATEALGPAYERLDITSVEHPE